MNIYFTDSILDLNGNPIETENAVLTLEQVCVSALLQPKEQQTGEDKYKRYKLSQRINGAKDVIDLTLEELTFLKQVVGESQFTALVVGQVWDKLECRE